MTKKELVQLQALLTKYYLESNSVLVLEDIKPCLDMVNHKLQLIEEGYVEADPESETK